MQRIPIIVFILEVTIFIGLLANPSTLRAAPHRAVLEPVAVSVPPVIDGVLTDEAWNRPPLVSGDFITNNPMNGQVLPQKTEVWAAYDSRNLYFAFLCHDTEPDKIKTSITQRDQMFNDDWVGISLDALGSRQNTYELLVNPNGIQADIAYSISKGEDTAPDWVWKSAAKITPEGYQVEMCIPLHNIRYQGGAMVTMGIIFARQISRLGISGTWPEIKEGQDIFSVQADMVLHHIATERNITVLPSVTFNAAHERPNPGAWSPADNALNMGLGLAYGITSSMTAEATVHPDFSQVESDAFQVEVNQRYPVFFSEKRPFFMEEGSFFNIAGGGYNMYTAVHTRRIVAPAWSAKLTDASGKLSYGALLAEDTVNDAASDSTVHGRNPRFAAARGKYTFNGSNYLGGIYTGHTVGSAYNHVVGADGMYIPGEHQRLEFSVLESLSRRGVTEDERSGSAAVLRYIYDTRSFASNSSFERYTRDFAMDTAFYERIGFARGQTNFTLKFYPDPKRFSWVKIVKPFMQMNYLDDAFTGMHDNSINIAVQANFARQGFAQIQQIISRESWAGKYFHPESTYIGGNVQAMNWLFISGDFSSGNRIFYDTEAPFLGKGKSYSGELNIQPNDKFTQSLEYRYNNLTNPSNDERVYSVNIINTRSTYQFNRYFFLRLILQYDSYESNLLQDYLASFTFIPGTVVHLGYGSLSERNDLQDGRWVKGDGPLRPTRECLFFKTSYLHRF